MLRRLSTILLLLIFVTTRIDNVTIATRFEPERMRVVDRTNSSILVRGNAPLNRHGKFDPHLILKSMESKFQKSYKDLIVVSLLDSKTRDEALVLQEIRQGSKGKRVKILHTPVAGSVLSLLPSWLVPMDTRTGGAWDLSLRLHEILLQFETDNTAIYFHCMRGMDRTGLVAGIYNMRFQNQTLEEVQQVNWNVANRKLQYLEEMSLKAGGERVERDRTERSKLKSVEL